MDSSSNKVAKRKRVSRACSVCRRKKVKCDGKEPCFNCTTSRNECKYEEAKRINKPKKRLTNTENINSLNSRLQKLESLLEGIANKIGQAPLSGRQTSRAGTESESDPTEYENEENDDEQEDEEMEEGEEQADSDEDQEEAEEKHEQHGQKENGHQLDLQHKNILAHQHERASSDVNNAKDVFVTPRNPAVEEKFGPAGRTQTTQAIPSFTSTTKQKLHSSKDLIEYVGSHSLLYIIFSDKSLEWFKEKLPPKHAKLLMPIANFPLAIKNWSITFTKYWTDPPILNSKQVEEAKNGSFPDYDVVITLLDNVYDKIFLANYLCKLENIKQLFLIYYKGKGHKLANHPDVPSRRLLLSEILMMNSALALCIAIALDKKMAGGGQELELDEPVRNIKKEVFYGLQEQCLHNCIFAYLRLVAFSEGITTIQGILLFVIYLEMNVLVPQVNYMLTSVAVRAAQSIGLHRFESFQNDTEEIADLKRSVWWMCQYLDMEICYRCGKPPLVNVLDVSTLTKRDTDYKIAESVLLDWAHNSLDEYRESALRWTESERKAQENIFNDYTSYILLQLNWLRAKGHSQLFSASVDSFSTESLSTTLREFNMEMCLICNGMNPKLQPKYYNDPDFNDIPYENIFSMKRFFGCGPEYFLTIHFTYFFQLMTVNRIPFLVDCDGSESDEALLQYRHSALLCARTILCISLRINHKTTPLSFLHWSAFIPFTAFMVLFGNLLNHIEKGKGCSEDDVFDINLLIKLAMAFTRYDLSTKLTLNYQRDIIHDLCTRVLLRILIQVVELNSDLKILESTPGLKEYLKRTEEVFPDLYRGKIRGGMFLFDEVKYSKTSPNSSTFSNSNSSTGSSPLNNPHKLGSRSMYSPNNGFAVNRPPGDALRSDQFVQHNNVHTPHTHPPEERNSARNSPAISNIMNPTVGSSSPQNGINISEPFNWDFLAQNDIDNTFSTMMNNMPNYFYDNNMGL